MVPGRKERNWRGTKGNDIIQVCLVAAHPAIRQAFAVVLEHQMNLRVIGQGASPNEDLLKLTHADVVIIDLDGNDATNAIALQRLQQVAPHVRVMVLASTEGPIGNSLQTARWEQFIVMQKSASMMDILHAIACLSQSPVMVAS